MGFSGFGAVLSLESEGLNVSVPVKFRKVEGKELRKQLRITMKSVDTDKLVRRNASVGGERKSYDWRYFDIDGQEVAKDRIKYFAEMNGKQIEVRPFERSESIDIKGLIPLDREVEFLPEATYEVWASEKDMSKLYKVVEHLHLHGKVGIANFSFGRGFKQSVALIKPVINGDRFILTMSLCQQKKEFMNWMPISQSGNIMQEVPTLDKLLGGLDLEPKEIMEAEALLA